MLPWDYLAVELREALGILDEYFRWNSECNEQSRLYRAAGAKEHQIILGTNPHHPPVAPGLSRETKQFIQWLAECHANIKDNFEVEFRPTDSNPRRKWNLEGFVSWLVYSPRQLYADGRPRLKILYDQELLFSHVTASLPSTNGQNGATGGKQPDRISHSERFKRFRGSGNVEGFRLFRACLTKIALHESAHIVWHLSTLLPSESEDDQSLTPPDDEAKAKRSHEIEEEQAWMLSLFWYGLLVADFALHCRKGDTGSGSDEAWRIA